MNLSYVQNSWLYVMSQKSQASKLFKHFDAFVKRKFETSIIKLQSDSGEDFKTLKSLLFQGSYVRKVLYSYTPYQNCAIENRYKHMIKKCISLLTRAGLALCY